MATQQQQKYHYHHHHPKKNAISKEIDNKVATKIKLTENVSPLLNRLFWKQIKKEPLWETRRQLTTTKDAKVKEAPPKQTIKPDTFADTAAAAIDTDLIELVNGVWVDIIAEESHRGRKIAFDSGYDFASVNL